MTENPPFGEFVLVPYEPTSCIVCKKIDPQISQISQIKEKKSVESVESADESLFWLVQVRFLNYGVSNLQSPVSPYTPC